MKPIKLLLVCLTLVASSCASEQTSTLGTPVEEPTTTEPDDDIDPFGGLSHPPEVSVSAGADDVVTSTWAYCWSVGNEIECASGERPDNIPTLNTDETVTFTFPIPGWRFQPIVDNCDSASITFNQLDETTWEVIAEGQFESVTIDLFGRSAGGSGDAIYSFILEPLTSNESSDGANCS